MRNLVRSFAAKLLILLMAVSAIAQQATITLDGETIKGAPTFDPELMASLRSTHSGLSEQDALDIAEMIISIRGDPESIKLLEEMRSGSVKKDLEELRKTMDEKEIIEHMVRTLYEMKATEILFADPGRAFEEMKKEGMIPAHQMDLYAQNPKLLEADTRKGLFFSMLSLAAAGGYL
jgi:hypothetical protein